jgi:hypothetical protein
VINHQLDFSHLEDVRGQIQRIFKHWQSRIEQVELGARKRQDFAQVNTVTRLLRHEIQRYYQANQLISRSLPLANRRLQKRFLQALRELSSRIVSVPTKALAYDDLVGFKANLFVAQQFVLTAR